MSDIDGLEGHCAHCKFADFRGQHDAPDFGDCVRRAPAVFAVRECGQWYTTTVSPEVGTAYSCGEFEQATDAVIAERARFFDEVERFLSDEATLTAAPSLTPELRAALDALVAADRASRESVTAFEDGADASDDAFRALGRVMDDAQVAYEDACEAVVAAYKAGAP